jgi:hypothetical protein
VNAFSVLCDSICLGVIESYRECAPVCVREREETERGTTPERNAAAPDADAAHDGSLLPQQRHH